MGVERGASSISSPYVTKRLCLVVVLSIGILCVVGGFLLGNMARTEIKRRNDIVPFNLTIHAEKLYKKAKRKPPKAIHHNRPEIVTAKLLEMFHCSQIECGTIDENNNIAAFVKTLINVQVTKLIRSITNASAYLDSLT